MDDDRRGCFGFLFQWYILSKVTDWFQRMFGFKSGNCFGCGCGCAIMVISVMIFLSLLFGTDFTKLSF